MKKSYFVLILCGIGYLLSLLSRSCPTVLVDYMTIDFAFTPQNIGYVSAATMFSYGFMQLPAGILADAFGPRKILIIFTLIAGIATLGFAFSQSQTQVIISRFFIGVGVSLSVISITMLSLWFPPQTFARANSILCGISELGPVLAATPLLFVTQLLTWRGAMLMMAVIVLGLTLCWFFFIPEISPYQVPKKQKATFKSVFNGLLIVIRNKDFWPMCLWQMVATGSIYMMINLWFIEYMQNTSSYGALQLSSVISIGGTFLIFIQFSVGFISDMIFHSRKKVLILITVIYAVPCTLFVFAAGHLNYFMFVILGIMFMCGISGSNICNTMVKEICPKELTGTALGLFNMFYPLWTALTQILFGKILNYTSQAGYDAVSSYRMACGLVLFSAVLALICSFTAKDTYALSHTAEQK